MNGFWSSFRWLRYVLLRKEAEVVRLVKRLYVEGKRNTKTEVGI